MAGRIYHETFENGAGGWIAWLGQNQPTTAEVVNGALISRSPWGIDSNHAPPGAGYLNLLFILFTRMQPDPGPLYAPLMENNRFIEKDYPTDFRNARLTVRLKGEVDLKGAQLYLHCQATVGTIAINLVLTGQPFTVTQEWSEQTVELSTDPAQWLCLGARHDMHDIYGCGDIDEVLRDVNLDIILLLYPINVVPVEPEPQGPHHRRPEVDYAVDTSILPEGYVMIDEIRIEFHEDTG
jgi:hypothetical protein